MDSENPPNFARQIELFAQGAERIEAVVIGNMGWTDYNTEYVPNFDSQPREKVLSWDEARKWLDYDWHSGFGAPKCNAVYVWTPTSVIFITQYDGSTNIHSVPRNPVDCEPYMPGG